MTEKIVGAIKISYTGSIFGLLVEWLTDLTVQTAFWEIGARAAFSEIAHPRTGLLDRGAEFL